ncbi:E3 ubiquitin-protein ligase DTX3L-like [Trichosurus vulpecula]|uniref:E3 ubiquitin-protein ligase DTX3L-like n=1 Tax=Trichosurus vulpecula TaxID=9337 RepID=UPI00186AE713|nr:E3 ubiquitin-protein ligase DTX3L-like [Trichosurus vulpecula]
MATGASACGPPYRVQVRASESCSGLEKKLQKYFQSRKKSGGGECMVKAGPTEGTFWLEFSEREAKERVIAKGDHTVEVSATSHVKVFIETNETSGEKNTLEMSQYSSQTQSLPKEFLDEKHPEEGGASGSSDSIIQKIFLRVEAYLTFNLSREQREKIINLCPNLRIETGSDGKEKVIGDYQDIQKIYQFLSERILGNDQKEDFPHSASSKEIKEIMPNDWDSPVLPSNSKHRTEELDSILVPSHLYEYFKLFFPEILDRIEKEHKVHIKNTLAYPIGSVCLDFETNNPRDRKAAEEAFTRAFQREIQNVTSQEVHFTDNQLALEVQKTLVDRFKILAMRAEGKVLILLGNPQDILEAKHFIEANFSHKQPVKIMVSQNMMRNGIEVDTSHLCLLCQEIIEIEKKYDTTTEMVNQPQTGKTLLVFKPKDKGLDLSAHAYEYFIDVFQMILAHIVKEVVILKPLEQGRKSWSEKTFFEDFKTKYPFVNFEWNELQLTLTSLPKYLTEAIKYIKRYFSIESPAQQRAALSFGGNWNEDPKSPLEKNGDDFKVPLPLCKGLPSYGDLEKEKKEEEEECVICMEIIHHKEVLPKCKHTFCGPCIREAMKHKPVCPICQTAYGIVKGNQPDGKMTYSCLSFSLPGYDSCGTIEILYDMSGGIQTEDHPNPGKYYSGTKRTAYLPDNEEGRQVLNLLKRAFKQKLIFTIGQSRTSGVTDVITWNDIHHKTKIYGGPENFAYPDPGYLERVKMELKAKGIE